MKSILLGLSLLMLSGMTMIYASDVVGFDDVEYAPAAQTLSTMTKEKACHDLIKYGKKSVGAEEWYPKPITDIKLISGGFEYDYLDGGQKKAITLFANVKMVALCVLESPTPNPNTGLGGFCVRVLANTTQGGNRFFWFQHEVFYTPAVAPNPRASHSLNVRAQRDARCFLDALYVLVHHPEWTTDLNNYQYVAEAEADSFDVVVKKYHAHKGKMLLSQEVRKFYIQAQDAVNEKRYDDAIDDYQKALEAAPWWALGYYNCGLIMVDQDDYEDAIDYFGKYIKLEPHAKDAQDVQDKIYSLQGKMEQSGSDSVVPTAQPAKAF